MLIHAIYSTNPIITSIPQLFKYKANYSYNELYLFYIFIKKFIFNLI